MTNAAVFTPTLEKKDFVIDVGANIGDFALEVASRNPSLWVLAIEPNPTLCQKISVAAESRLLRNVEVLNVAIDVEEKSARFHVSDHTDSGISSLLEFDSTKITKNDYWSSRSDLFFDRTIEVTVKRLESILSIKHTNRIRFIKIDAQGVDLNVLASLGKYLQVTEAGMLEVPATLDTILYRNEAHDLHYALMSLSELGFKVYAIKPNDHAANEFNVFFCREDIDYRDLEQNLGLRGIDLYNGKHFWHFPSNKLEPVESRLIEAETRLKRFAQIEAALHAEHAESTRLRSVEAALHAEHAESTRLRSAEAALHAEHAESTRLRSVEAALHAEHAESTRLRSVEAALHAEHAESTRLRSAEAALHAESTRLRAALEDVQSKILGHVSEVQYLRRLYIVRAWLFARQILSSLFRRS